jgi:vancomycin resistance protein YoaR
MTERRPGTGFTLSDTTTKKRRRGGRRGITGPVLVLCALLSVLVAADYWSNAGKIYRGVWAGSVAVGGKTPEEAERILKDRAAGALREIRLTGPEEFVLDAEEMSAELDATATVDRAYAVGRSGGLLERLGDRAAAALGVARVAPAVDYRPEAVRAAVEDLAARLDREPRAASVVVRGVEARVTGSEKGYELDVPATTENAERAIEDLSGEAPVVGEVLEPRITTPAAEEAVAKARRAMSGSVLLVAGEQRWDLSPAEVGEVLEFIPEGGELRVTVDREALRAHLEDMYADLTVKPVEAGYDFAADGSVIVKPGKEGQKIEEERFLGAIEEGLFVGKREYEVPIVVDKPELTTAEAERLKPTQLLGSYRTDYSIVSDTGARVENLEISSEAISGTFLAPGEVFSMNDTVSHLDYNETKVIINGRETKADGGGLCQVTSTLYNAVNEAGLDVTERHPHYAQLPYIRPGLDATVWFGDEYGGGALDMKFTNTTDAYVLLREHVADDGYIYAEVWGQPNGTQVRTWSEPVYRGRNSAKWITYQTYKKDGRVVFDGVLHKDTYEALRDKKGKLIPANSVPIAPVNP